MLVLGHSLVEALAQHMMAVELPDKQERPEQLEIENRLLNM